MLIMIFFLGVVMLMEMVMLIGMVMLIEMVMLIGMILLVAKTPRPLPGTSLILYGGQEALWFFQSMA